MDRERKTLGYESEKIRVYVNTQTRTQKHWNALCACMCLPMHEWIRMTGQSVQGGCEKAKRRETQGVRGRQLKVGDSVR